MNASLTINGHTLNFTFDEADAMHLNLKDFTERNLSRPLNTLLQASGLPELSIESNSVSVDLRKWHDNGLSLVVPK